MIELLAAIAIGLAVGFVIGIVFGAALWHHASDGVSQVMVTAISEFGETIKKSLDEQDERMGDLEIAVYSGTESDGDGDDDRPSYRPFRGDGP